MNTQYPAGTGFDPRYQRPNGMNVGGVGNIYTPQPKEEEEGVNPLAVLAGLAAAGATAVGGYYGGKKLGMWGKGKPPTTAVADNVPTGRIGRTGNLYADLNDTAGSTEAAKVREDILNDARFYGRTKENSGAEMVVGDHIRAGSPNAKWRKDALALGQLNRGLGLSPFSGEYDDSAATLRAYAEGVREELLGKPSGSTQVANAQKPTLTDIADTPKIAQTAQELLADAVRNQTGIGDEAWDSGPAAGAIPGINTEGYVPVDNNDDLWTPKTQASASLTDVQLKERLAELSGAAVTPSFGRRGTMQGNIRDLIRKSVDPNDVVIEGYSPEEIASFGGQDPRAAMRPGERVSESVGYEYPSVVKATTLRSSNPKGFKAGGQINVSGKDFNIIETDDDLNLLYIQDPKSKQPTAVRIVGPKDPTPDDLEVDVSRFFVDATSNDILDTNAREAARDRKGKSYAAKLAETLGIPLKRAKGAVRIGNKRNQQRKQDNQVFSVQELLADPSKGDAMLGDRIVVSPEENQEYMQTTNAYLDRLRLRQRQNQIDRNAFKEELVPTLQYPIDKLGPVGLDKKVVLRKGLPAPIELSVVSVDNDAGTFLARNRKSGEARKFEMTMPGEEPKGGLTRRGLLRENAEQADALDIFRQIAYKELEEPGSATGAGLPEYEGFKTLGVERPTPTMADYSKSVLDPLTFMTHSQRENDQVRLLHPFAALNAGLSGGFDISDMDLMDLQKITKRTSGDPSLLETLSNHEKHVLERATSAVMAASGDATQNTITNTLLTGELSLPDSKGLSWDTRDPNVTKVRGYSPRTKVSVVGRGRASKPGISSYSQYLRNPLTGELGRPGDFGISNDPSDYGGIGRQIGRFTAGFEPRQPNLEMTGSLGSGKVQASAEDEINYVLGIGPENSGSNSPRRQPKAYAPNSFLDLLQRTRQGQQTLDLEDSFYKYDGVVGTDRGYKPIDLIDESPTGILAALGTGVKLDKNNKPYIKSSAKITDQTLRNASVTRGYEQNQKGRAVARSLGDDGAPISYAPGGLTDGTNGVPIGLESKKEMVFTPEDSSIANELNGLLGSSDIDLTPEQLTFKEGLLSLTPGERSEALAKTVALVRSGNKAKAAANKIGMEADRRVQSARTDGVSLREFLPKSGSLTDDDTNELPDALRNQIIDEIPTIQRLAVEGKISAEEVEAQMGQTALSRGIRNILGGVPIEGGKTLAGTGLPESQIAEVQARIGQESPLITLMGSGNPRTEGRKKQAAIQQIHEGINMEQRNRPGNTAGQGMGRNYDNLPSHKSTSKLDSDKKDAVRRFDERKARARINAIDTVADALAEKGDAITEAETDILTRKRNNAAGGSVLDKLLRTIRSTPDEQALPEDFSQVQPVYVTQLNDRGETVQVPKLDKNGRQLRRRYASDSVYDAIQGLNESEASLAGLEIDPAALVPAGVDKNGKRVFTREQGDIANYSRSSVNDFATDKDTIAARNAYLRSDLPGITIQGREGRINLGQTYSDLEDDVMIRNVVDRNAVAPEEGRRPKTKQTGGWPVSWTPETARDYTEDVQVKDKWSEEARRDPKGIYGETERINAEIDQRNAERMANPTGNKEYDELEERINPFQLQARIKANPSEYSSDLVRAAAGKVDENYQWQGRGMDQNPLLAATTLEVLDDMGLGRPKEISDYVDVMKLQGTQYSGNSAPKLLGSMMYQTLIGQQGRGTSRAKINRPEKPEDPNNPLSSSYQSSKDSMGRFARPFQPNETLQRQLGITRGSSSDAIDASLGKAETLQRAVDMGFVTRSVAEKMSGDERITSELLQTKFPELRPGRTIDPSYPIPEQVAEAVRRGLMSAEEGESLKADLLKEDRRLRPAYKPPILLTQAEREVPSRISVPRPVRVVKAKANGTAPDNIYANETGTVTNADLTALGTGRPGTIPKPRGNKATERPNGPSYGQQVRQVPVYNSESGEVPSAEFMRLDSVGTDQVAPGLENPLRLTQADRIRMARERRAIGNKEQKAANVISDVLAGRSVSFENDSDSLNQTGATTEGLRSEALRRDAQRQYFGMRDPAQKSLFGSQEYIQQNEELVPFMTPDGRISRATPREIERIGNTQAQEKDMARIRRMDAAEKGIQYPLPGILSDTQLPLFDVGPLTSRRQESTQRQDALEQINQTVNQRISDRVYQPVIPGLATRSAKPDYQATEQSSNANMVINPNSPGYVQQRLGNGNVIRQNYLLPESSPSRSSIQGGVQRASTDRIQRALDAGQISQQDAARLMAERDTVQEKLDRFNSQSSGAATIDSLTQRLRPANQGVVMRNLNG